jgi:hypothetical protein
MGRGGEKAGFVKPDVRASKNETIDNTVVVL